MNNILQPCPFCGGHAQFVPNHNGLAIRCMRCGARMRAYDCVNGPDAIVKWNTRAGEMTLNEYQRLAQRTSSEDAGFFPSIAAKKIDNGVLGMAGESGECADNWKKHIHQKHPFEREKMIKEAGDVLWYVAELAAGLGVTLEEIATRNVEKLGNRYPYGFDAERSIHREGTED